MARKKKMSFKLDPEWLLKEPLDFEFNKYIQEFKNPWDWNIWLQYRRMW